MAVARRRLTEGFDYQQLLGGVGQMIVATDDVGDPPVEVVDGHREVVERRSVGAGDDQVVQRAVRRAHLPHNEVIDDGIPVIGDPQPHGAVTLVIAAKAAVVTVLGLPGLDVVAGCLIAVGAPIRKQLVDRRTMALLARGLEDRPLVPVELEPAQRLEDLLDVLRRRA